MRYPSKISYGLLAFILAVLIGSMVPMLLESVWTGVFVHIGVLLFIAHLYGNTYYVISEKVLVVRSSVLIHKEIPVESIQSIAETNSIISAPALSFDRLEVCYGQGRYVVISPKEKASFIQHLTRLNPTIALLKKD